MTMLEGLEDLSLDFLNRAMQAWVEREYNRSVHTETGEAPLERFCEGRDVLRPSPDPEALRRAFRRQSTRSQRRSDGTVSVEGVRFEIPGRFRHLSRVTLQYARWDLRSVDLVDERSGDSLARLFPLDRTKNADGRRRALEPTEETMTRDSETSSSPPPLPPLLESLLREHAERGLPPGYLPKPGATDEETES